MVMETPSPQCVGREFVRQYYTLLNKAPLQLHRFYSDNSSFVHGGLDRPGEETKPVVGQQEIHCKIVQLNFQDCHAKIRQVDSHETLGNGVVIQVTGELSNNGQPMRRFMQTFVLALQSPLKYYVRNDIFRYQDEVFNDDDETDNRESITETTDTEVDKADTAAENHDVLGNASDTNYYDQDVIGNGNLHTNGTHPVTMPSSSAVPQPSSPPCHPSSPISTSVMASSVATPAAGTNSSVADYHRSTDLSEIDSDQQQQPPSSKSGWEDDVSDYGIGEEKNDTRTEVTETQDSVSTTLQSEPKTYAKMVSKPPSSSFISHGTPGAAFPSHGVSSSTKCDSSGFSKPGGEQGTSPGGSIVHQSSSSVSGSSSGSNLGSMNQNNCFSKTPSATQQRPTGRASRPSGGGSSRGSLRDDGTKDTSASPATNFSSKFEEGNQTGSDSDTRRRPIGSQYPDSQQLFVGNLHRCINEEELKEYFMKFGEVLDTKIYSKPNQKVPNYGFIVFDNIDAVQKALSEKSLNFNGHRLNVEEKKTKPRDPRIGDNRMSPGRGGMMGRGGGPGGSGRGMRGGGGGGPGGGIGNSQGSGRGETRVRGSSYGPRRV